MEEARFLARSGGGSWRGSHESADLTTRLVNHSSELIHAVYQWEKVEDVA
jgi:hypothetical protein